MLYIPSDVICQPIPLTSTTLFHTLHATLPTIRHLLVLVLTSSTFLYISNLHSKNSFQSMHLVLGWLDDALQCYQTEVTNILVSTTITLQTPFLHELHISKGTRSSCQLLVCTLPPWVNLLLFPFLRAIAPSMESFYPLCDLSFLHVFQPCHHYCYLLKDYHDVASVGINKSSITPSASETCAPYTTQQSDFKFLLSTYHVNDSTLQCIRKFIWSLPTSSSPITYSK